MTKTLSYWDRLSNFMDDKDIQTGEDLEGNRLVLVESCEHYDLVEKIIKLSLDMKEKGYKLNDFLEYFSKIDSYEHLHFSEDFIYCGGCGNYARHAHYGVNDEYYIAECECICKNCYDKEEYIDYLLESKTNCNVLMSDEEIKEQGYYILTNYEFNNDMYGGKQADKGTIELILKGIPFFYYLNTVHMFGTYYTICVHKDNIRKALKALKNHSALYSFHN